MEVKRATTMVALCMLMLLSGQQQVAAETKFIFCDCYLACYDDCRKLGQSLPRWLCLPKCVAECTVPIKEKVATPTSVADCSKICLIHICGSAATDASGVAACVDDCTNNWSQYAKHL